MIKKTCNLFFELSAPKRLKLKYETKEKIAAIGAIVKKEQYNRVRYGGGTNPSPRLAKAMSGTKAANVAKAKAQKVRLKY